MKTLVTKNINQRLSGDIPVAVLARSRSVVELCATIRADTRRVLYAITIPEYMEAWLQIQGASKIRVVAKLDNPKDLSLQQLTGDRRSMNISVTLAHIADSSVTMIWREIPDNASSIVHFCLWESGSHCRLTVRHEGLVDEAAEERYALVWQQSLFNLSRLLNK